MKSIVILLAICVFSEIHCIELCTLVNSKAKCKPQADCDGEIGNYGTYVCSGSNICCIAPDSTTPEPTTPPPPTEPPTTTEEPTTMATTTVLPVTEQCGVRPQDDKSFRILGGNTKTITDWPWMVSIRGKSIGGVTDFAGLAAEAPTQSNTEALCAGVFIHEQYIATTAFCVMKLYATFKSIQVDFEPTNNILVNGGDTITDAQDFVDNAATEKQYTVIDIIPHKDFEIQDFKTGAYNAASLFGNSELYLPNNLALLKLEQPVVFNDFVRKSCSPNITEGASCSLKKTGCFVAGYGDISATENDNELKDAAVEVFNKEVVDVASQFSDPPTTLPALQSVAKFTGTGNVCEGDNGGMVVCPDDEGRWALEGLVSIAGGGNGCNPAPSFNIVDMKSAWPWIESEINK